ncbi:hypothetical protein GCG54_00000152 [Colletotrichum gloeosporioides]|uniref:Uncharacterized protein n=1 Tax=Colletotrichum gloeosporioides TaxID=474922 RepID=A0A8H4C6D2_COLGL|nr:uncharacterized protein GCG54_00000152 [Colletotrichum gloeosporioides]KAF3798130.1 hypothetical protein GCG54_00000152 [Colletotrichum gloeosporioides]
MSEQAGKQAGKTPRKIELALPPVYQGSGSYTEARRGTRDVHFAVPGSASRRKPVEVIQVDTTAVPQPFLDPTVLKKSQQS